MVDNKIFICVKKFFYLFTIFIINNKINIRKWLSRKLGTINWFLDVNFFNLAGLKINFRKRD